MRNITRSGDIKVTYKEFKETFSSLHQKPKRPSFLFHLFRVDFILLTLAAVGGVVFSAFRTFTLIAEQSGSAVALFAVFALECSMAGLIVSQVRKNQGDFVRWVRSSAMWVTVAILLLILIVTNASYEIRQVGLAISEQGLRVVLVVFLGVMIPILVVINLENLASRMPEYLDEYRAAMDKFYQDLLGWNEQLEEAWEHEQSKEFSEDVPARIYTKEARREFILEQIQNGVSLNKTRLAERFNVSTTTIHNDIKELTAEQENDF